MAVNRLLNIRPQYVDANGNPASGYRLFFYVAGSTTKQNTYNSSSGVSANTNPIVLNSSGQPAVEIWGTVGQTYKIGFAAPGADDPPGAFLWTEDNIATPEPAIGAGSVSEWVNGSTPTFVSSTSFSVVGDQRTEFHVGRRIKATVTAGTAYSVITASSFGSGNTTVTVVNDSTALDSGLSAVQYGLLSSVNTSSPRLSDAAFALFDDASPTRVIKFDLGSVGVGATRLIRPANSDVAIGPPNDLIDLTTNYTYLSAPGRWKFSIRNHGGSIPTAGTPVFLRFRETVENQGGYNQRTISSDLNFVMGDGSTFGTVANVPFRLYFVAIDFGGTVIPGVYNPVSISGNTISYVPLDESRLWNTTSGSDGTAADSAQVIYSTSAVTARAIRILGFLEGVQTTPGTHANGLTRFTAMAPGVPAPGSIIQRRYKMDGSYLTLTTTIPYDNTIPQSTEGGLVISDSITPTNGANLIAARTNAWWACNGADQITYALFKGSATDAVSACNVHSGASNQTRMTSIEHLSQAGTTSSITYTARIGADGATTTYVNGNTTGQKLGAISNTIIALDEIFT